MFCPYPGKCENDRYIQTGVHSCAAPKCPYQLHAKAILEREIQLLEGIPSKTKSQKKAIERLKKKYWEEFGKEKRGGGNAPPD